MSKTSRTLLFLLLFTCCFKVESKDSLIGPLSIILSETQVKLVADKLDDSMGWLLTSEDNPDDPIDGFDSGYSYIREGELVVGASQDCGSPSARAIKTISTPLPIDNIKWVINLNSVYFDNAGSTVNLNYGGINIQVVLSESTIPFMVYNGATDLVLVIRYKNGVLTGKVNGVKLRVPFPQAFTVTTTSDTSSKVDISASASAADCYATAELKIDTIIASTIVED